MQFQRRDAAVATEDMNELLARAKKQIGGAMIYGGCLCCCNGRGKHLFGRANHDAELVQERLGPLGLSGFFLQRRNWARRQQEFSPRLHRVARVVRQKTTVARPEHCGWEQFAIAFARRHAMLQRKCPKRNQLPR